MSGTRACLKNPVVYKNSPLSLLSSHFKIGHFFLSSKILIEQKTFLENIFPIQFRLGAF